MPAASAMEPATTAASPKSADACMTHAGEPVIASHLGFPSTADSAECTAIAAGVLAFKTLRTEALPRLCP
jgi:hypothetical protein